MPKLVGQLEERAEDYRIAAVQIKKTCDELCLGNRVDTFMGAYKR